jgi:hypothetical protein
MWASARSSTEPLVCGTVGGLGFGLGAVVVTFGFGFGLLVADADGLAGVDGDASSNRLPSAGDDPCGAGAATSGTCADRVVGASASAAWRSRPTRVNPMPMTTAVAPATSVYRNWSVVDIGTAGVTFGRTWCEPVAETTGTRRRSAVWGTALDHYAARCGCGGRTSGVLKDRLSQR